MARCPGLMLYQPKSTNMVDLYCTRSWLTSSSPYESKVLYCKTFKAALIIHLYKRKGNHQQYDNHCGISLLSITGKVVARVLLNCLTMHLEKGLLPESQCGFHVGQGTMDMIFTARHYKRSGQEQRCDLYTPFVDLTKAFDTVSRDGLWKILAKYGCPEKLISIV